MTRCFSCGLAVRHHRGRRNESLSCEQARREHPRASVIKLKLATLLRKAVRS